MIRDFIYIYLVSDGLYIYILYVRWTVSEYTRACASFSGAVCDTCPGSDTRTESRDLGECPSINRSWTHRPRMYHHTTSAHHYSTTKPYPSYLKNYVRKPKTKSYVHEQSQPEIYKNMQSEPKPYGKRRRWRF